MGCIRSKPYKRSVAGSTIYIDEKYTRTDIEDDKPLIPKENLFEKNLLDTYNGNVLNEADIKKSKDIREEVEKELIERKRQMSPEVGDRDPILDFDVEVVGSCRSGIGTRDADVDITLIPIAEGETEDQLSSIADYLKDQSDNEKGNFQFIALKEARVPVIKLKHKPTDTDVDITWNQGESLLIAQLLDIYAEINSIICPLIILVKLLLKKKNLLRVPKGYMNGFQISMMVIHHQQERNGMSALAIPESPTREGLEEAKKEVEKKKESINESVLVVQLRDFFKYYYEIFDYFSAIDVREGQELQTKLTLSDDDNEEWWAPLAIVNPITGRSGGNCGISISHDQLYEVRNEFSDASQVLV